MATNTRVRPFADTKVAKFLSKHLDALAPHKNQREIALELGYVQPNMISMLKNGDARVPLDKVAALAKAINVDPAFLLRLTLEQYPGISETITEIHVDILTKNEKLLIDKIRKLTKDSVPNLNRDQDRLLKEMFPSD